MANDPVVIGSGPRHVLALHGWFGSATGWGPFADLIDRDRYSVVCVDYRGYGARRGETGDFSLPEIAAEVQGNPVPVAVLVGEHDPALGAAVMEQTFLRQYPNSSLEVLSNAGHYAMFETPVALLTSVERFLDQL